MNDCNDILLYHVVVGNIHPIHHFTKCTSCNQSTFVLQTTNHPGTRNASANSQGIHRTQVKESEC